MIYLEACAGLCNRMRVIASAYNLAKEYNTKVKVLWAMDEGLNCKFYSLFKKIDNIDIYQYKNHYCLEKIIGNVISKKKYMWINITEPVYMDELKYYLKQEKNVYIKTMNSFYQGDSKIFVPVPDVVERIDAIMNPFKKKNIIGVHIRRSDNKNSIEFSPTEMFMSYMIEEVKKNKETLFFLATDSTETEKYLKTQFGDRIITSPSKTLDRNSPQGIKDALVDLGCLSRCKYVVGSYYSSFSEMAAEWGEKELIILKK